MSRLIICLHLLLINIKNIQGQMKGHLNTVFLLHPLLHMTIALQMFIHKVYNRHMIYFIYINVIRHHFPDFDQRNRIL